MAAYEKTREWVHFDCRSCDLHIVRLVVVNGPPDQCAVCAWLDANIADVEDRERLRRSFAFSLAPKLSCEGTAA